MMRTRAHEDGVDEVPGAREEEPGGLVECGAPGGGLVEVVQAQGREHDVDARVGQAGVADVPPVHHDALGHAVPHGVVPNRAAELARRPATGPAAAAPSRCT